MTIREWALLALAVIAGVPLYALVAGWTARLFQGRVPRGMILHSDPECPQWWTEPDHIRKWGQGPCNCDAHRRVCWVWPAVLVLGTGFIVGRTLFVIPARAAYRAALRGGRPVSEEKDS